MQEGQNGNSPRFKNYRFEDLDVWKTGMKIVGRIYSITRRFPKDEQFALVDQLKRASTSIVLNIAEGSGQSTAKGFALYTNRAKSSVLECVACLKIAVQEKFVVEGELIELNELLKEGYFKLIALEKSLRR